MSAGWGAPCVNPGTRASLPFVDAPRPTRPEGFLVPAFAAAGEGAACLGRTRESSGELFTTWGRG